MKPYLVSILLYGLLLGAHGGAEDQRSTVINVDGEKVVIARDEYGVPHVFADTNKALFTGYGYAVAEDGPRCRRERRLPDAVRPGRWSGTPESDPVGEPDQQAWAGGGVEHLQ